MFLQVSAAVNLGIPPAPLLIADLHFEWSVKKSLSPAPDTCELKIFNLNPVTKEALNAYFSLAYAAAAFPTAISAPELAGTGLQILPDPSPTPPAQPIQLFVGWQGRATLLFAGDITELELEQHTGTDIITRMDLSDSGLQLRDTPPAGGNLSGVTALAIIAWAAPQMNLRISPAAIALVTQKSADIPLKLFRIDGSRPARDNLDDLFETLGLGWKPINGWIVAWDGGLRNELLPVRVAPGSGLLNYSRLDDGGYRVKALGQSELQPGGRVFVFTEDNLLLGAGPMWCNEVEFTGHNDGMHEMVFTMRKIDLVGQGPSVGFA